MRQLLYLFQRLSFGCFVFFMLAAPSLAEPTGSETPSIDILSPEEWEEVDVAIERGTDWLIRHQQPNGSFPTLQTGQPGVTSLCVLALLSQGHTPGEGRYSEQVQKALEFILDCQQPNGLVSQAGPIGQRLSRNVPPNIGTIATYNHAISSLLLSEAFAMGGGDMKQSQKAIEKALQATLKMQSWKKTNKQEQGGWRYVNQHWDIHDSDLSVTGWQLMFLRSAKNAGFDVSKQPIDDALAYIQRCFNQRYGAFGLMAGPKDRRTRGMAAAGILALAHGGLHDSKEARLTGDWLLKEGFANYNETRFYGGRRWTDDRYHYGVFYACRAMYQLGGDYWRKFYPPTIRVILDNQDKTGCWAADSHRNDGKYGKSYTTALMVLALGSPNQLLPIFQR